jgi:hypothetical protein
MNRSERVFRALLCVYPRSTREASGEDMVQLFTDRLRDAESRRERATVWLASIVDIATTAPEERFRRPRALNVAQGPTLETPRPIAPDLGIAAMPLVLSAVLINVRPNVLGPLFDERLYLIGMPAGLAVLCLTAVLAAIGILAARRSHALADADAQAILITSLAAPFAVLYVLMRDPGLVVCAWAVTLFVLVARFRALMLALTVPFFAWLLFGSAIVGALVVQGS